jgi:predicted nucleic acid binding AN1-type Zn finger protein
MKKDVIIKKRCEYDTCKRKLRLMPFICRCKRQFCATHRHSFDHNCTFDFKKHNQEILKKTLVKIDKPKLTMI